MAEAGYDESVGVFSSDITLRIQDSTGNFIGVLKAVVNVESITNAETKMKTSETGMEVIICGADISNGVKRTPTFFIVDSDGVTERIDGPQPLSVFSTVIDSIS